MMAEIVNLRMARKAKAREEAGKQAEANRTKHGRGKAERALSKAEAERAARALEGAKLNRAKDPN